jgi:hypothetical protein
MGYPPHCRMTIVIFIGPYLGYNVDEGVQFGKSSMLLSRKV